MHTTPDIFDALDDGKYNKSTKKEREISVLTGEEVLQQETLFRSKNIVLLGHG